MNGNMWGVGGSRPFLLEPLVTGSPKLEQELEQGALPQNVVWSWKVRGRLEVPALKVGCPKEPLSLMG